MNPIKTLRALTRIWDRLVGVETDIAEVGMAVMDIRVDVTNIYDSLSPWAGDPYIGALRALAEASIIGVPAGTPAMRVHGQTLASAGLAVLYDDGAYVITGTGHDAIAAHDRHQSALTAHQFEQAERIKALTTQRDEITDR